MTSYCVQFFREDGHEVLPHSTSFTRDCGLENTEKLAIERITAVADGMGYRILDMGGGVRAFRNFRAEALNGHRSGIGLT